MQFDVQYIAYHPDYHEPLVIVSDIICSLLLSICAIVFIDFVTSIWQSRRKIVLLMIALFLPILIVFSQILLGFVTHTLYGLLAPEVQGICTYYLKRALLPPTIAILSVGLYLLFRWFKRRKGRPEDGATNRE